MTPSDELRDELRAKYGGHNYRITKDGQILARGKNMSWRTIGTVEGGLSNIGRPPEIAGKRYTVYLDEGTHKRALILGAGNISLGLRRACEVAII